MLYAFLFVWYNSYKPLSGIAMVSMLTVAIPDIQTFETLGVGV